MIGWIVDLIHTRLLLWRVKRFIRLKEESVHDLVQDPSLWARRISTFWTRLWARCKLCQDPFVQFLISTLLGFCGGVILILLLLLTLVLQVQMNPYKAVAICVFLTPPLCLGLAFSSRVRCATLLVLPQLSSKRGRQAIVAFAIVLTITGPVANTLSNMEETARSLTCGLHIANRGLEKLVEVVKRPVETAKKVVDKALKSIEGSIEKIKETLSSLQRVIAAIGEEVEASVEWLRHISNVCNNEFGTPIERCYHMFEKTSKDCSDTLGPMFSWLCSVVYATSLVCNTLSGVSLVCYVSSPIASTISDSISEMRERFMEEMNALFFVQVDYEQEFDADFDFDNRTMSGLMLKEMKAELRDTLQPFLTFYHLVGGILGLTWILVFYKAHRYHQRFRTNDRFDNYYITEELRAIDLARIRQNKEAILPLRPSEKRVYCSPGQMRLLMSERRRLMRSLIFLFMSTINIAYSIWCDYSLYWVLDLIRREIILPKTLPKEPMVQLKVDGQGLLPDMFRNLSEALTSSVSEDKDYYGGMDPTACLPSPIPPDFNRYTRIASLLVLAWLCAFLEPLILRLRPAILNRYYPERARARALWLSGHILRERGGFFRDVARLAGVETNAEPLGQKDLIEKLKDRLIFGSKMRACCVICASAESDLFECQAIGCNAIYCKSCFDRQANICAICEETMILHAIDGLELERDSSDDEPEAILIAKEANDSAKKEEQLEKEVPLISPETELRDEAENKAKEDTPSDVFDTDFVSRFVNEAENSVAETGRFLGMELPKWK